MILPVIVHITQHTFLFMTLKFHLYIYFRNTSEKCEVIILNTSATAPEFEQIIYLSNIQPHNAFFSHRNDISPKITQKLFVTL